MAIFTLPLRGLINQLWGPVSSCSAADEAKHNKKARSFCKERALRSLSIQI